MKSIAKSILILALLITAGLSAGCGGGGGGSGAALPATATAAPSGASAAPPADTASAQAVILYEGNCADCHGALDVSTKKGITLARLQNAITNNIGGMGYLAALPVADQQSIVSVLTPATTPPATGVDGASLYAANCAGCHLALASSTKPGRTAAQIQAAINANIGGMGFLSTLTPTQVSAIAAVLPGAPTTPPPPVTDGATLYATNCASCHLALASSTKPGRTAAQIQAAINANTGGMGYLSTLTPTQVSAIAAVLPPAPTTPPPAVTDGATLYATNCASCHLALASSTKAGRSAAQIQAAINANTGGMGYLSTLTPTQVSAIAAVLPPATTTTPPPCGSCHAIPPATGKHAFHAGRNIACAICHGTGYSTTTVNAATHNNGTKNLVATIGWTVASRSCSNSCHGRKSW